MSDKKTKLITWIIVFRCILAPIAAFSFIFLLGYFVTHTANYFIDSQKHKIPYFVKYIFSFIIYIALLADGLYQLFKAATLKEEDLQII